MREVTLPYVPALITGTLPVTRGGTGVTSANEVVNLLDAVPQTMVGVPGGLVRLNAQGVVQDVSVLEGVVNSVSIVGLTSLVVNQTATYIISNYDIATTYTLTANGGSVSRNGDTITYTAPSVAGTGGFTINGRVFAIAITMPVINTPSITSPINGSTGLSNSILITSSAFSVAGGSDTHANSDWQLATDSGFTNVVQSSIDSSTNKTSWSISGLSTNTTYYLRVRYSGAVYGDSGWSNTVSFTTRASFYPQSELAKLVASDGSSGDYFGASVSISSDGNTAIVGAYRNDNERGSAYIYTRTSGTTWTQQSKIVASDGTSPDNFGYSVSISSDGNTAIVGAINDDSGRGSAYIYTRSGSTWTQQSKIVASDGATNDGFGISVSISSDGNTAIVGSYRNNTSKGSAYIYTRSGSTWTQQAKIVANDAVSNDWFGFSVSISNDGNTAIVGAYVDDNGRGSAYIFTRSGGTWTQQAKLVASDGADGDWFGYSLAISGDGNTAIVGARNDDSAKGSAYIYTRSGSTWTQQAKLLASDGAGNDRFGFSVAISGDGNTAILGAYLGGSYKGVAYVYTRTGTTWSEQTRILASDGASSDYFGWSVSISSDGNTAIVSAHYDDNEKGTNAGGVYVYTRTGTIWTQKTKLVASDGTANDNFGVAVAISSDGNTAIVGTNTDDNERGTDAGSAYIFY